MVTLGEIERKVREYMLDTEESAYRYQPYLILSGIIDGIKLLCQRRPAARYNGLNLIDASYPYLTTESTDVDIEAARAIPFRPDPRWEMAVRYFACSRCFEIDSADTVNMQRAQDCRDTFTNLILI